MAAVFEDAATKILGECSEIFNGRGEEYRDTWALPNQVSTFMDAILRKFNINMSKPQKRLLQLAVLVDVKDSRMLGPWKKDTLVDGINYRAVLTQLMDEYDNQKTGGNAP